MNIFDTKLFGPIPFPESINEIADFIDNHSNGRKIYMWRGQGDINWAIHSSAYRRLTKWKNSPWVPNEVIFKDYERELLSNARHQGYDFDNGRILNDFELLAKLQHHGAATRLIDVSRNMLVALWFACRSQSEKNGLLLGIRYDAINGFEGRAENRTYDSVFGERDNEGDDGLNIDPKIWQPPVVTKRIAAQSAQFLYSTLSDSPMGSLVFDKNPKKLIVMGISPEMKLIFLKELEEVYDIRQLTLFPDFDGFCYANNENFNRYSNDRW